jgi:glyoxylase-like metal-dependent hydrolase (beta-lactamase superfamily II)
MLVAENVHQIRSGYHGIYAAAYLVTGKDLTLIDSGESETWREQIEPYLRKLGRDPRELHRVIHTHGHDDHVHSDLEIRAETGAEIWISETGARFLEEPGSRARWEESLYDGCLTAEEREAIRLGTDYRGPPRREEPILVDRRYRDGETLEAGPLTLRVVHAPGHTVDSYCLVAEKEGLLFTGDAVNGEGTDFDDLPVFQDLEAMLATMTKLQGLPARQLLAAHPYLPFRESVLDSERGRELMRRTASFSSRMTARITELLAAAGGPLSTAEISARICAELGPNRPEPRPHGTVRLHLVAMARQGRVAAQPEAARVLWLWRREASG